MKTPKTPAKEPKRKTGRKEPASVSLPVKVPMKKRRKIWKEPIQDMSEGGRPRAVT
jgi:hypothetical protein